MLPIRSFLGAALLLAGTAAFAPAAGAPDKKLPEFELFDFAQTGATSVADLAGRAVL
ncbi:MAG: hypothetical protein JNJ88_17555 [Planctomycetes bacterium]|nr:hypothetical protein [Planctomycetota bacterium]